MITEKALRQFVGVVEAMTEPTKEDIEQGLKDADEALNPLRVVQIISHQGTLLALTSSGRIFANSRIFNPTAPWVEIKTVGGR